MRAFEEKALNYCFQFQECVRSILGTYRFLDSFRTYFTDSNVEKGVGDGNWQMSGTSDP